MSRSYGQKFLLGLHKCEGDGLGVTLARSCVGANLPAKYVALALGVSRMTVYNWFRNKPVCDKYKLRVEALIALIKQDTAQGVLPAKGVIDAKLYMEALTGNSNS